jgi:hypothetical protein
VTGLLATIAAWIAPSRSGRARSATDAAAHAIRQAWLEARRHHDHQAYPLAAFPVLSRPAGRSDRAFGRPGHVRHMRVYSDDPYPTARRLELELFLPGEPTAVVIADVDWVEPLEPSAPARFLIGLRLTAVLPEDEGRIDHALAGERSAAVAGV